MKLLIDIGNSRIKTGILEGNSLAEMPAVAYCPETFSQVIGVCFNGLDVPEVILVSNVAGADIAGILREQAAGLWHTNICFPAVAREWHGLINGYKDISQMGVDRWLSMIAAWSLYRSFFCVVSCGTAVTIDAVLSSGQHLGGLIIPGLELMQTCLSESTAGIRNRIDSEPVLALGTSTAGCISSGTLYCITSLIERVVRDLQDEYDHKPRLLLTGGNAGLIKKMLSYKAEIVPALVLKGLIEIAGDSR